MVWSRLPVRKYLVGYNRVFDVISALVQEWPEQAISGCKSGETPEVQALQELSASCKRHLALIYGREWDEWESHLTPVIWQSAWLILQWYRQKPSSKDSMSNWRSNWVHKYRSK